MKSIIRLGGVDDAIVIVENTSRYIEKGLSPKEAAIKAMGAGMGFGMGAGMAQNMGPWGAAPNGAPGAAAAPPPPPPTWRVPAAGSDAAHQDSRVCVQVRRAAAAGAMGRQTRPP